MVGKDKDPPENGGEISNFPPPPIPPFPPPTGGKEAQKLPLSTPPPPPTFPATPLVPHSTVQERTACVLLSLLDPIKVAGDGNCAFTALARAAAERLKIDMVVEMGQGGKTVQLVQVRRALQHGQAFLRKVLAGTIHEYASAKQSAAKHRSIEESMKRLFISQSGAGGANGEGCVFSDVVAIQKVKKVQAQIEAARGKATRDGSKNTEAMRALEDEVWATKENQEAFRYLAGAYSREVARNGYYVDTVTMQLVATLVGQPIYVVQKQENGAFGVSIIHPSMEEEANHQELYVQLNQLMERMGKDEVMSNIFLYRTQREVNDEPGTRGGQGKRRWVGHYTYLCPRGKSFLGSGPEGDFLDTDVQVEMLNGGDLPREEETEAATAASTRRAAAAAAAATVSHAPSTSNTPAPIKGAGKRVRSPDNGSPDVLKYRKGEEEEEEEEEGQSKSKLDSDQPSQHNPPKFSRPREPATPSGGSVCPGEECGFSPPKDGRGVTLAQVLVHIRKYHALSEETTVEELRSHFRSKAAGHLINDINEDRLAKIYICKHCGEPYLNKGHEGVCEQVEIASQQEEGVHNQAMQGVHSQGDHAEERKGIGPQQVIPVPIPPDVWELAVQVPWSEVFAPKWRFNPGRMTVGKSPLAVPWIDLVETVAGKVLDRQDPFQGAAEKLIWLLPDFLLHKPIDPEMEHHRPEKIMAARLHRENVIGRVRTYLQHKVEMAKKEATTGTSNVDASQQQEPGGTAPPASPPSDPSSTPAASDDQDERQGTREERAARKAKFYTQHGSLSRATQMLAPNTSKVLTLDAEGVTKVQQLFPKPATRRRDREEDEEKDERRMEEGTDGQEGVREEEAAVRASHPPAETVGVMDKLIKALKALDMFAAGGPSGWGKLLCPVSDALPPLDNLLAFISRVTKGQVAEESMPFLYGGRITPLDKGNGGIRPIVVGEFFAKWASKALLLQHADKLKADFNKWGQYGVCIENGLEIVVQAMKIATELSKELGDTDFMIAQLDCSNAYNTISRQLIRDVLAADLEYMSLLEYFDAHYPVGKSVILTVNTKDGPAQVLSTEGVHQGDPLGPVFFSLGLARVTGRTRELMSNNGELVDVRDRSNVLDMAYIDDVSGMGPSKRAMSFASNFQVANEELEAGLNLSIVKCKLWMPLREDVSAIQEDIDNNWERLRGIEVLGSKKGIVCLGVPTGPPAFVKEYHMKRMKEDTIPHIRRLHKVGTHQLHVILLRYCAVPRANFLLRTTEAEILDPALRDFDEEITRSLARVLGEEPSPRMRELASLPVRLGGVGLGEATSENQFRRLWLRKWTQITRNGAQLSACIGRRTNALARRIMRLCAF